MHGNRVASCTVEHYLDSAGEREAKAGDISRAAYAGYHKRIPALSVKPHKED